MREIIDIARKVTGHPIPVRECPRRAGDPAVLIASSDKVRRLLGWNPQYSDVESILASAWEWHRSHPHGYRPAFMAMSSAQRERLGDSLARHNI